MKQMIKAVVPGSIAEALDIAPGDRLLRINEQKVKDVLDYRFLIQDETLLLEVMKPDGEIWELDIEKDEDEDLGILFKRALMDKPKHCRNKCAFCFIDQMPPDLRGTLYFKDDDPRLSFLTGNYITLTNLTPGEVRRVAHYHLSPLHISVHATDAALRRRIMGNPHAGRLLKILCIFNDAGITMHFQIVLCKGLNDGTALDDSIRTLLRFKPGAASLSVVPAGLTRYRSGLYPLTPFNAVEAAAVVRQVERWQKKIRARYGTTFVFCADEFYLQAGMTLPPYKHYEDFPQLENGVGMTALFEHQFVRALNKHTPKNTESMKVGIVTGRAAESFMIKMAGLFRERFPSSDIRVYAIENDFFGPEITVSGLLTGRDIIRQIGPIGNEPDCPSVLFIPQNAFRANPKNKSQNNTTEVMLDDMTLSELSRTLGVPIKVGSAHGGRFFKQLWS